MSSDAGARPQFRAEACNNFNRANFADRRANISLSTIGQITAQANDNRTILSPVTKISFAASTPSEEGRRRSYTLRLRSR